MSLRNIFSTVQKFSFCKVAQHMVSWTSLVLGHRLYSEKLSSNKVASFLFQGAMLEKNI